MKGSPKPGKHHYQNSIEEHKKQQQNDNNTTITIQSDEKMAAAREELVSICKRFDNPKEDLLKNPNRYVVKTGTLKRQAQKFKHKQVDRWCILCNDIFVFTKESNGKLEQKQIIDLNTVTLDNRTTGKTSMKNSVCITSPDREYVVGAKKSYTTRRMG